MAIEGNKIKKKKEKKGKSQGPKQGGKIDKSLQNVLGGGFLTREKALSLLPFLMFLAAIALFYIGNNYVAEKKIREIEDLNSELKELRYEYITVKSELMFLSKQSQVAKKLKATGIKESTVPPEKIKIEKED